MQNHLARQLTDTAAALAIALLLVAAPVLHLDETDTTTSLDAQHAAQASARKNKASSALCGGEYRETEDGEAHCQTAPSAHQLQVASQ